MKREFTGSCLCGAVRFEIKGEPIRTSHCHCRTCQKAAGAAFLTFATFHSDGVSWTGDTPAVYPSSEIAERGFCPKCGATLTYRRLDREDTISIAAACFDDPNELTPGTHIFTKSRLDWVKLDDGLPQYREGRVKK